MRGAPASGSARPRHVPRCTAPPARLTAGLDPEATCIAAGAARAARETSTTPAPVLIARPARTTADSASQVGLARELHVERLESLGGLEQQSRSIAAVAGDECELRAQQLHSCALQLVERPGLSHGQQSLGHIERPCTQADLRSGERALRPPRRIGGQRRPSAPGMRLRLQARRAPEPVPPSAQARTATCSSGPTAAAARCHARRSGSASLSVASANARWTARRCSTAAERYTAERTRGWRKVTRVTDRYQSVD